MNKVPIKVYSKKDVQNLRRLIREEAYTWIDNLNGNRILQSMCKELEVNGISLSENDKKALKDYVESEDKWNKGKVRKEVHKFVKGVSEVIRNTLLDTLPESSIPSQKEKFNQQLFEESKNRVSSLILKLKEMKENMKVTQLEQTIEKMHEAQLKMIDDQIEEMWKNNEEQTPEHFGMKELQMVHSEMTAENQMLQLILERQTLNTY